MDDALKRLGYSLWGLIASGPLYRYAERHTRRSITPRLRVLERETALPFAQRKAAALERLIRVLEEAGKDVPYYRDLFAAGRFIPEKLRRDERYLEDLPYLTKDILREQGRRLVNEKLACGIVREQKTGSSTGPAVVIYYDQEALDWTAAQNILMLAWGGKRRYDREVHLSTRFQSPPSPEDSRFEARKCLVLNRRNVYTGGFDGASQEILLQDLQAAHARIVQGHSSSLFALARYLKAKNISGKGIFEIFVSTGEMISSRQRALIEEVFGARVSDRYGACEFGVMAQELAVDPKHELLVSDSLVWPEMRPPELSSSDGYADMAGIGELVFSNLRNRVMPLIRYCMGDLGKLVTGDDGWRITEITGRTHDVAEIDGVEYPTHYIQDILDRCGYIEDFQILVRGGKAVEFRLVASREDWEGIARAVRANFPSVPLRRIGADELVFVGARGKFSYILREDV
ncbi:MAG: phenylacetate--CoA ligase family protein [Deltaproteobacteria bacterium]|jgi:phenylacetate-CoA ligase|nr:phenylacetate--CoA ligase family protein [Deltaproteobacteria bacterium]